MTHPGVLTSAATAAKRLEIAPDRLVLLEGHLAPDVALPSIGTLIDEHEKYPPYAEHCFKPGEAKTAVAFLYFSSGTTGNPKASMRYNINPLLSCVVPCAAIGCLHIALQLHVQCGSERDPQSRQRGAYPRGRQALPSRRLLWRRWVVSAIMI